MITIIEGTDGTGKTTFAKKLARETNATYLHASAPTQENWMQEYVWSLEPTTDYVIDRWHVGEMIWPKYFGRDSLFKDMLQFNLCNYFLATMQAKIIIVTRDVEAITSTLAARGEHDEIENSIKAQQDFISLSHKIKYIDVELVDSDTLQSKGK